VVQAIGEAWLQLTAGSWSQEAEENACLQPTPKLRELLAVTNAYFMSMIELHTATPPLAMTAAYKETLLMSLFEFGPIAAIRPNTE